MTNQPDPLDSLIMKTEDIQGEYRKILAHLLIPYIWIDPEIGEVHFKENFSHDLNSKQQVFIYLLGKLAISQKNKKFNKEVSTKDVETITGLPGGTVRPKLIELYKEKFISKSEGGYYISIYNLQKAHYLFEMKIIPKK